jgi:hypothetical protein
MVKISFNGVEYNRPEDMPADVRAQYERAAQMLPDRDQNGIPDLLESANQSELVRSGVSPVRAGGGGAPVTVPGAQVESIINKTTRWLPVIVIGFIGGVFACVALAFFGIMGLMKTSGAYQLAVETARSNPTVQEILGTPVSDGLFTSGSVSESGAEGEADLGIPLSGPRQNGTLRAKAVKEENTWRILTLILETGGRQYSLIP